MKAAVSEKYCPPEVVHIKEVEKPIPNDEEVLIKVRATTVNRTDCGNRIPEPSWARLFTGLFHPKNTILGNEFSGEIEAIGKSVKSYKVGDPVFGMSGLTFRTHAQYICMHENHPFAIKPTNMTFEEAAAICEGHFYALNYFKEINIQPGQSILINGSTGAIGSSAVQLAKHFGAKITAVANTKNLGLVKSLGADQVIDYLQEDFTKVLDQQFDFIFDAVGKSSFSRCKHLLKPGGTFFASELGPYWQTVWLALWTAIFGSFFGKKVIFPIPKMEQEYIAFFKKLAEAGEIRAVIDRQYPLEKIVEAYRYVETGEKTGSVVIQIPHDD